VRFNSIGLSEVIVLGERPEEIEKRIREWLEAEGIFRERFPDSKALFHLIAELPPGSGRRVHIIQPLRKKDLIIVVSTIVVDDARRERLRRMKRKEKNDFLWNLRFGLLFRKNSFQMVPNAEDIQRIPVSCPLFYDGLTKNTLMEAMHENWKCHLYIDWMFQREFEENSHSKEPPSYHV